MNVYALHSDIPLNECVCVSNITSPPLIIDNKNPNVMSVCGRMETAHENTIHPPALSSFSFPFLYCHSRVLCLVTLAPYEGGCMACDCARSPAGIDVRAGTALGAIFLFFFDMPLLVRGTGAWNRGPVQSYQPFPLETGSKSSSSLLALFPLYFNSSFRRICRESRFESQPPYRHPYTFPLRILFYRASSPTFADRYRMPRPEPQ